MITSHEIADGHGGLLSCSGSISLQDIYDAKLEIAPRFPNMPSWYFGVVDLYEVSVLRTDSPGEMDMLVGQDIRIAKIVRPGFLLAVVARAEVTFGIARMWQAISDGTGWDAKIFRERAAAEAWIQQRVNAIYGIALPPIELSALATLQAK